MSAVKNLTAENFDDDQGRQPENDDDHEKLIGRRRRQTTTTISWVDSLSAAAGRIMTKSITGEKHPPPNIGNAGINYWSETHHKVSDHYYCTAYM